MTSTGRSECSEMLRGPKTKFAECNPRATLGEAKKPDVVLLLPLETAKYATGVITLLGCIPVESKQHRVSIRYRHMHRRTHRVDATATRGTSQDIRLHQGRILPHSSPRPASQTQSSARVINPSAARFSVLIRACCCI